MNLLKELYGKSLDDGTSELRCKIGSEITRAVYSVGGTDYALRCSTGSSHKVKKPLNSVFFEKFYAFLEKSYIIMITGAPTPLNDVLNGSTFFLRRYAGTRTEDI